MHDGADPLNTPEIAQPRRHKGIYVLPNMITLAALFSGFYAVVMSMNGRYDLATVGIFVAMVLDSLDGRVARLTHTQSAFGEQMDSLSDMVSFGAAPALIAYEWALRDLGRWGWIAAFVYCACAALRLARFNVNTSVVDKRYFQGLPSPAAAALVAGFIWLATEAGHDGQRRTEPQQVGGGLHRRPVAHEVAVTVHQVGGDFLVVLAEIHLRADLAAQVLGQARLRVGDGLVLTDQAAQFLAEPAQALLALLVLLGVQRQGREGRGPDEREQGAPHAGISSAWRWRSARAMRVARRR